MDPKKNNYEAQPPQKKVKTLLQTPAIAIPIQIFYQICAVIAR